MATMTFPLAQLNDVAGAEKAVGLVDAWLVVTRTMNSVKQACVSFIEITGAFHEAVKLQDDLIAKLNERAEGYISSDHLLTMADNLDHLVSLNQKVIVSAEQVSFQKPWAGYLCELRKQAERLDSIAESFRMGADADEVGVLHSLVANADQKDGLATAAGWRDLVASLHD